MIDVQLAPKSYDLSDIEIVVEPLFQYDDGNNLTINLEKMGNLDGLSVVDVFEAVPELYFDIDGKLNYAEHNNYTQLINGKK